MRCSSRTWYSLVLFALCVGAVMYAKPRFVYREDGSMYEFGLGPDKSVFSFGVVVAAIALLSSFVFALGDMIMLTTARPRAPRTVFVTQEPPVQHPAPMMHHHPVFNQPPILQPRPVCDISPDAVVSIPRYIPANETLEDKRRRIWGD